MALTWRSHSSLRWDDEIGRLPAEVSAIRSEDVFVNLEAPFAGQGKWPSFIRNLRFHGLVIDYRMEHRFDGLFVSRESLEVREASALAKPGFCAA